MSFWKSDVLFTRFWRLLFGQCVVLPTQSRRQRSFAVEPLEDRQLLSVSSFAQTDELLETEFFETVCVAPGVPPAQQQVVVDVTDTTSASLMEAFVESDNLSNTGSWLSEDELPDDVGMSYSLGGLSLTLEDELPAANLYSASTATVVNRPYGPMTYSEYLASLPSKGLKDPNGGGGPMMSCGCGCDDCGCGCDCGCIDYWFISLSGCIGVGCFPSDDTVTKNIWYSPPEDKCITVQTGNDTASVYACAYATGCLGSYSVLVDISGEEASTYFGTTSETCNFGFTWTKPNGVANADAKRDFTFTYYAIPDSGGSSTYLGTLKVHVGYAEVWGWANQANPGHDDLSGPDPNYTDNRQMVGHGSWEIVVDSGTLGFLKKNTSTEQIALLDTYANHKWGWGAVDEQYFLNPDRSINFSALSQDQPGILRCDDDYETRYTDNETGCQLFYPYNAKKGWTISLGGLMSVLQYTKDLDDNNGVNGPETYNIVTNNCVHKAVGAINVAGISSFSTPTTQVTIIPATFFTSAVTVNVVTPGAFGVALVAAGGEQINVN